ncbi:MAG: DDE-type integrase/transposase/recombinase [Bacteroidetes bacterium]|nr:DDE-type integrase/transposase/recombinase [Bacteroidota bacterium]
MRTIIPDTTESSNNDPAQDQRTLGGEVLERTEASNVWTLATLGSASVNVLLGAESGEEVPVSVGEYAFGDDATLIRKKEMEEIPRILKECKDAGCPDASLREFEAILLKAVENTAKCLSEPPRDRGKMNFHIDLIPGAVLKKAKPWPENNPAARQARLQWEENLLQSGRAYLTNPEEVDAISNVTTPLQGNSFEEKKYRPCGVYCDLNDVTVTKEREFPTVPGVRQAMHHNVGLVWVTDAQKGFYTCFADEESQKKMAVWSLLHPGKVIVPRVMMFGLKNAPATFDELMVFVFQGLDIQRIVDDFHGEGLYQPATTDPEERNVQAWADGIRKFDQLVLRAQEHAIPLALHKTHAGKEVKLLGGIRTIHGYKPDPVRVQALKELPEPKNRKELMSSMFLLRWFAEHSPNLQIFLGPLNELTSSKTVWRWGAVEKKAWADALEAVQEAVLLEPFVWTRKTALLADSSDQGHAFWLVQVDDDGRLHIIQLKSKAWSKGQKTWSTIHKECVALIDAIKDSEHFLHHVEFTAFTDHRPLLWLLRQVRTSPTMWGGAALRYVMYLSQFRCQVKHIAGKENDLADMLSRFPFANRKEAKDTTAPTAPQWFLDALAAAENNAESAPMQARTANPLRGGVAAEEKKEKRKPLDERRRIFQMMAEEPPIPLLELSKRIGLFSADPNFTTDVFAVLAKARLEGKTIPQEVREKFEEVLEEVEAELPSLSLKQGRLMREEAFYIPLEAREDILWAAHKAPTAGHFKAEATLRALSSTYWWPYMKEHVEEYVSLCGVCYRADGSKSLESGVFPNHIREPFHTVELDFQEGPFPSAEGFRYRLTGVDAATKFSVIMHTKSRTADEAIQVIYEQLACKYAWPRTFRCDNDTAFTAEINKMWATFLGIRLEFTAPYRPQGVAFVDASHKLQNRIMRGLVDAKQTNWYEVAPFVQKALNSFVRRSSLFSAEQLLFGQRGTSLVDALVPFIDSNAVLSERMNRQMKLREIVAELEGRARGLEIRDGEEKLLPAGSKKGKKKEGNSGALTKIRVGMKVGVFFRSAVPQTITKWKPKKHGPYEVTKILNNATVKLRHVRTGIATTRGIQDLHEWSEKDEEDNAWEVQSVDDEQLKPVHRFLVRFRGFPKPEWTEAENISCWDKVDAFRQSNSDKFPGKLMVIKILETKTEGKTQKFKVFVAGDDKHVDDARWIKEADFRNPEIIRYRE